MAKKKITYKPKPGPEHKLLNVFVGKWNTKGETEASPSGPAAKIIATDTYEWFPGDFFLIHHIDGHIGDNEVKGIEIIGYDSLRKTYYTPFFDNQGNYGTEQLNVKGNTWTWTGNDVMGVKAHRCTATFSDNGDTITARHEQSNDGVNWLPWMVVKLTREK